MAPTQTPAGTVFFAVSMSLDGFIAPAGMDLEHADDPSYRDWGNQWAELQSWVFPQRFFRENLGLGEGGETGADNDMARGIFERTGVTILGKRMFDGGELFWPEEAPFHTPVFVVTHTEREPMGTPRWHHVPLRQRWHRERSGPGQSGSRRPRHPDRRRRRPHPAVPAAGLVDEFTVSIAPVVLGDGTRLFDTLEFGQVGLEVIDASRHRGSPTSATRWAGRSAAVPTRRVPQEVADTSAGRQRYTDDEPLDLAQRGWLPDGGRVHSIGIVGRIARGGGGKLKQIDHQLQRVVHALLDSADKLVIDKEAHALPLMSASTS